MEAHGKQKYTFHFAHCWTYSFVRFFLLPPRQLHLQTTNMSMIIYSIVQNFREHIYFKSNFSLC